MEQIEGNSEMDEGVPSNDAELLIDRKILALEQSILELKHERNRHALIARLPFEVLGNIFVLVAGYHRQADGSIPTCVRFNFSYVSQHWRSVALSTPGIWGCLLTGSSEWCRAMLVRSKNTDLTIDAVFHTFESAETRYVNNVFEDHAHRIQNISIHSRAINGDAQALLECVPTSAPRLQTLRVVVNHPLAVTPWIPEHRLSDASVSIAEFKNCAIKWTSPFLNSSLRDLKIYNDIAPTPTLAEFLDALRRMPHLTSLDLTNALPSAHVKPTQHSPIVLPALQKLRISSATSHSLAFLLSCLVVPASATVDMECQTFIQNAEPFSPALSTFFSAMTGSSDTKPFHTISIEGAGARFEIKLWKDCWMPDGSYPEPYRQANFRLYFIGSNARESELDQVVSTIPVTVASLKTLILSSSLTNDRLIDISKKLEHISTIVLRGIGRINSEMIQALWCCRGWSDSSSYFHIPFPRLENLVMFAVQFAPHRKDRCVSVDALQDCLIERTERGAPLQKLAIYASWGSINGEQVEMLRHIVVDVDWDGR